MAFPNGDCNSGTMNKVTVVLGAQWGDEGKGKIVDLLATNSDIVCRVQVSLFNSGGDSVKFPTRMGINSIFNLSRPTYPQSWLLP